MTGGGLGGYPMNAPATPHGRTLLKNNLFQLNLPPEEWAVEVRNLNSQLIECLEQLYEREEELNESKSVIDSLEANLVRLCFMFIRIHSFYFFKQQMA